MPVCVVCSAWGTPGLCAECVARLRYSPPVSQAGLDVFSGLLHETVARRLVHLLKYQAVPAAGVILGAVMAKRLPPGVTALVPVPRATARRVKYGIDPAIELAHRVGATTGIPVVHAIRAPLWWPSHANGDRASRRDPRFTARCNVPPGSTLVDDVLTTGTTLAAAGRVLGLKTAITATRADSRLCD